MGVPVAMQKHANARTKYSLPTNRECTGQREKSQTKIARRNHACTNTTLTTTRMRMRGVADRDPALVKPVETIAPQVPGRQALPPAEVQTGSWHC